METISSREIDQLIYQGDALIVDLRATNEYRKKHIYGAINIPYSEWKMHEYPYGQTIVFYCERGANSMIVAKELNKRGMDARTLVGGINGYRGRFLTTN